MWSSFKKNAIDNESLSQGGKFEKALENIDNLVIGYSKRQEFVFGASYNVAVFYNTKIDQVIGKAVMITLMHPKNWGDRF